MYHRVNQILKTAYQTNNIIPIELCQEILQSTENFYLLNAKHKLTFPDIDDFDNFFPDKGILSIDIDCIINFINSDQYEHLNSKTLSDMFKFISSDKKLNSSMNNLILAIIHGVDISEFYYSESDIEEVINFILLFNNFNNELLINMDDLVLIEIFMDKLSLKLNKNVLFSLLLEREIYFKPQQKHHKKENKNFKQTITIINGYRDIVKDNESNIIQKLHDYIKNNKILANLY